MKTNQNKNKTRNTSPLRRTLRVRHPLRSLSSVSRKTQEGLIKKASVRKTQSPTKSPDIDNDQKPPLLIIERRSIRNRRPSCRLNFDPENSTFVKSLGPSSPNSKKSLSQVQSQSPSTIAGVSTNAHKKSAEQSSILNSIRSRSQQLKSKTKTDNSPRPVLSAIITSSNRNAIKKESSSSTSRKSVTFVTFNLPNKKSKKDLPVLERQDSNANKTSIEDFKEVSELENYSPTCYCLLNENVFCEELKNRQEVVPYCQALDLIDDKTASCSQLCTDIQLRRCSAQNIFQLLCNSHIRRLKLHQCCPICGLFCTHGEGVLICSNGNHLFHKKCALEDLYEKLEYQNKASYFDEDNLNYELLECSHCKQVGHLEEITLVITGSTPPTFFQEPPKSLRAVHTAIKSTEKISTLGEPTFQLINKFTADRLKEALKIAKETYPTPFPPDKVPSLLEKSIKLKNLPLLIALLMHGADANHKFAGNEQSLLMEAVNTGDICLVHAVLNASADINQCDNEGLTPLMVAALINKPDIVKYLISAGADKELKLKETGLSALHLMAEKGSVDAAEAMQIDLNLWNLRSNDGLNPLMAAARFAKVGMVKLLAEFACNLENKEELINSVDNFGGTALHWAATGKDVDSLVMLLKCGADVNCQDDNGETPLHIAVEANTDSDCCVLALLVQAGDPFIKNYDGRTPLDCCEVDEKHESENIIAKKNRIKEIFEFNRDINLSLKLEPRRGITCNKKVVEKIVSKDLSNGREINAIRCINSVDNSTLVNGKDFTYISSLIYANLLHPNLSSINKHRSCSCSESGKCLQNSCQCHTKGDKEKSLFYNESGMLNFPTIKDFSADDLKVFECNDLCLCNAKKCQNRVVQQRSKLNHLEVFRTNNRKSSSETSSRGWGVRSLKKINRGEFVCEGIGEMISSSEASKRPEKSYMFQINRSHTADEYKNNKGNSLFIDCNKYGNVSRFVKHSTTEIEPNLVLVKIFVGHSNNILPRAALFACREISAGEELVFDFGKEIL